jgi:ribosomal protein S18 acetylase RimI-like enzyme
MSDTKAGPLNPDHPELGTVSLLPWDAEHFGFPVATWELSAAGLSGVEPALVEKAIVTWTARTGARLVSVSVPANDLVSVFVLQSAGFRLVDCSLAVRRPGLLRAEFAWPSLPVREAEPADHAGVLQIAAMAFAFGRYHTDPWFPRELANRRYERWVASSLTGKDPAATVLVTGPPGDPSGFMFARLVPPVAKLLLAGVAPEHRGGPTGVGLYVGSVLALRDRGARVAESVISAANTEVANLYASLGFRFGSPTYVLHRHSGPLGPGSAPEDASTTQPSPKASTRG